MSYKNKKLLITGGTGSFGNAVLSKFIDTDIDEIRIFSRDEKKQDDMRKWIKNPKVKFYLGDVRDLNSVDNSMNDVNYVFHAAALKQVPSCEFYPMEALKTNVMGTENVLHSAIQFGVEKVICLSTDKAVYPINAMGISKALMEKVAIAKSRVSNKTKICVTRYGNVMGSRGSVIPLFRDQVMSGSPISITDPQMTRFMMTLSDAVDLVLYAFDNGDNGEILIRKSPGATILDLAKAIFEIYNSENHQICQIGTRHGEKLFESLLTKEEMSVARDAGDFFIVPPDLRDLNYEKFTEIGSRVISTYNEYNSHNTYRMNIKEIISMIHKGGLI
jgi:UDP-N-acetylglucosamine 4,6-dehydratase